MAATRRSYRLIYKYMYLGVAATRRAYSLIYTYIYVSWCGSHETGHGLGPTVEFYTLVCRELQRRALCIWRDDSDAKPSSDPSTDFVHAAHVRACTLWHGVGVTLSLTLPFCHSLPFLLLCLDVCCRTFCVSLCVLLVLVSTAYV